MKNTPKPNLGKSLAHGEKVTVRTTLDTVIRVRVHKLWRRGAVVKLSFVDGGFVYERIFRRDEGTVWVRGWDTEEALAMIVGEALR